MRNGLNISGVSEFVNEIRSNTEEAIVTFKMDTGNQLGYKRANINAVKLGTINVARNFSIPVSGYAAAEDSRMTDVFELLLTSLGGCVMATYVQGCSAKGITITGLEMKVSADVVDGKMQNISYDVDIDCEGTTDDISLIAMQVTCFSPNHRTFIEENHITFSVNGTDISPLTTEDNNATINKAVTERKVIEIEWQYGTQLLVKFPRQNNAFHTLWVDQPKQVVGIDKAPNPQEYLLAALTSELLTLIEQYWERPIAVCVKAHGNLDFRGLLNLDNKTPIKVHKLFADICFDETQCSDRSKCHKDIAEIVKKSVVARVITAPQKISVKASMMGKPVGSFTSDLESVMSILSLQSE